MAVVRTATKDVSSTISPIPIGTVMPYAGSTAPTGWLMCDGTAWNATTNPGLYPLYRVITNTYGGTNDTDFKVPDLRGRMPVGSGTGTATGATAKTLGSTPTSGTGGEETHLLTGAESGTSAHGHSNTFSASQAAHIHTMDWTNTNATAGIPSGAARGDASGVDGSTTGWSNTAQPAITISGGVSNSTEANATQRHNIMQPYTVLNYIIKI